ncbi:MAG: hypothetical protein RBR13_09560 [Tenuifilaceae bacterium]|nr:hypothetical protein [Tenuifilaceae bacterium]
MNEIFGSDIALDVSGEARVSANGELILVSGPDTGVQDIHLMLKTPVGGLFYQRAFGSRVHEWVREENTAHNRMAFTAEVIGRVQADPRVRLGSVACRITRWDEKGLSAAVSWHFVNQDHPYNLVLELGEGPERVVADVHPDA